MTLSSGQLSRIWLSGHRPTHHLRQPLHVVNPIFRIALWGKWTRCLQNILLYSCLPQAFKSIYQIKKFMMDMIQVITDSLEIGEYVTQTSQTLNSTKPQNEILRFSGR